MIYMSMAFVLICFSHLVADDIKRPNTLFGITADDMFELAIGEAKANKRLRKAELSNFNFLFDNNNKPKHSTSTPTPINKGVQVTPLPKMNKPTVSLKKVKLKVKQIRAMQLLKDNNSLIPDFKNGGDDPDLLTRRFDEMLEYEPRRQEPLKEKGALRQIYLEYNQDYIPADIRDDKYRLLNLMRQFIYMIRYRMGIMTALRKKYMNHIKYKIGYLFALLRLVRYQQKILYSTLKNFYDTWRNPMLHLQFYFKVLKLDVDRKDIVKYVLRLNHDMKLFYDPTYYDDSREVQPWENSSYFIPG